MREEIGSLIENRVWELVPKVKARSTIVKGRWVFELKLGADKMPIRYKARWVIKGYTQEKGKDYD